MWVIQKDYFHPTFWISASEIVLWALSSPSHGTWSATLNPVKGKLLLLSIFQLPVEDSSSPPGPYPWRERTAASSGHASDLWILNHHSCGDSAETAAWGWALKLSWIFYINSILLAHWHCMSNKQLAAFSLSWTNQYSLASIIFATYQDIHVVQVQIFREGSN